MLKKSVTIVSGFPLTKNPRTVKEADVLADAGFDVTVLGAVYDASGADDERAITNGRKWKAVFIPDNSSPRIGARLHWLILRLRRKIFAKLFNLTGRGDVRQIAYSGPELLGHCLMERSDLYIMHCEQSLWVGLELLKRGLKVAVDFEDWYSRDMPPTENPDRPAELIAGWEKAIGKQACFATTTSRIMAQRLGEEYGIPAPKVVYNSFPSDERETLDGKCLDRIDPNVLSITWCSQNIGTNRGLEMLMSAVNLLEFPVEVHLRGNSSDASRERLLSIVDEESRCMVHFHPVVPHAELLSRIAEHDIGYAGETGYCDNNNLTIANKVFQYFLAGVPVVASKTWGQCEIADHAGEAMQTFELGDDRELAQGIRNFADPVVRNRAGDKALKLAESSYSWKRSAATLVELAESAISQSSNQ